MKYLALTFLLFSMLFTSACGEDADLSLNVAWVFESGDCASNNIETVLVTWGPDGNLDQEAEFACGDGGGYLGDTSSDGGRYGIGALGFDADGIARVENLGKTVTFHDGGNGGVPIDITLRPKRADVEVTWNIEGSGPCPNIIMPYYVTIYNPPAEPGDPLTDKVTETSESCDTGEVTFPLISPGDYVVRLDNRATIPSVQASEPFTVIAGENTQVQIQIGQ